MSLPTVSVIIPAFNAAEWIEPALSSVVAQSYPKDQIEILIVDDGSTDDTVARANAALAGSGVRHIVLQNVSPRGPSAARNQAWRSARGDWIQFLDADDLIAQPKIERQIAAASDAEPNVAVVFSRWAHLSYRDGAWLTESEVDPSIGADPMLDLLRADNFMATGSQLFRRAWLEKVGGYVESYHFIEDVDLLLRIVSRGGILQHLPSAEPLFWYRQRAGSLARSDRNLFVDGCVRNARFAERIWRERNELTTARSRALAEIFFTATRHYAEWDSSRFQALILDLDRLDPGFIPAEPRLLRLLSKVVGYPRAESCALRYRRVKQVFRSVLPPHRGFADVPGER